VNTDQPAPDTPHQAHGQDEGFPMRRLVGMFGRLPAYARLAVNLSRDPAVPPLRRAAVILASAYLVSPIDAVPSIIPLAGQLDDLLVIVSGVHFALAGMDDRERMAHLQRAGISDTQASDDVATLRRSVAWTVGRVGRIVGATGSTIRSQAAPALARIGRGARRVGSRVRRPGPQGRPAVS
jgi:uncharacterized membrane protein YkvA (DUF1232 family)